jgi:hypothetical protein
MWRRTGNTLPPVVNGLYWRHLKRCQQIYAGQNPEARTWLEPQSVTDGYAVVRGALDPEFAAQCSRRFDQAVLEQQGIYTQPDAAANSVKLQRPVDTFGDQLLDALRGPLDEALRRHFRSHYRLESIDCYRSMPSRARAGSWLWHKDNVPFGCIKAMLHLTPTTAETGAMRFLDWADTRKMHRIGYFGVRARERIGDIAALAAERGQHVTIRHVDAKPGDVLIFNNNLLHSAVPPEHSHRDVCTILVLPNEVPWDAALRRSGRDHIQDAATSYPARPQAV